MRQSHGIKSKFPHPSFRDNQGFLLDKLDKAIRSSNIRFVLVEAPTGFGKTAVAGAAGAFHGPSYYLTEQKIHQDQMTTEFPEDAVLAKGRDNYHCGKNRDDCGDFTESHCFRKPSSGNDGAFAGESDSRGDLYWQRELADPCPYFYGKTRAMEAPIACLNYSYFFNETYYSGDFGRRNVVIADEAHNIGRNMRSFLSFFIRSSESSDDFSLADEVGIELRDRGEHVSDWESWILSDLYPAVEARYERVDEEVERQWDETRRTDEGVDPELLELHDRLDEILCNIRRFDGEYDSDYFDDTDWAVEREFDDGSLVSVSFTPVSVAPFAERFLFDFGDTTILMSATILDFKTLLRSLGLMQYLDDGQIVQYRFPSSFDSEIRPVRFFDTPSINNKNKSDKFPTICELIDQIVQRPEHLDEKGLIHSVSYANEQMIRNNVSRATRRRLLSHDDRDRDEVLDEFEETSEPRILMSPSMYEGVDLKYDKSRFQILPKVPYLYRGSKVVQYKEAQDPRWYSWRTAIRIVQAIGRSVRAEDDYAKTYILDGGFKRFLERNGELLPDYLTEDALERGDIRALLEESLAT